MEFCKLLVDNLRKKFNDYFWFQATLEIFRLFVEEEVKKHLFNDRSQKITCDGSANTMRHSPTYWMKKIELKQTSARFVDIKIMIELQINLYFSKKQ